ncbi:MAG: DedA family protein [Paludibacteraceae bacterium]|nr:DedA family protein [Paludibacteraceae bacterium]
MEWLAEWGYVGLFIAAFLAATVLPFASEAVFSAVVWGMGSNVAICVIVATIGNTLGGMTGYYLGRLGKVDWLEKYFKAPKEKVDVWIRRIRPYGDWIAFFSFLPGVGDFIAIAAGFLRCRVVIVCLSMAIGKGLRYFLFGFLL